MKSSELIKLIKECEKEFGEFSIDDNFNIGELKEDIELVQMKKHIPLKDGDKYYYIDEEGVIHDTTYGEDYFDMNIFVIGNMFKTREDAEFEVERRKVEQELLILGGSRNYKDCVNDYGVVFSIVSKRINNTVKPFICRYEFEVDNYHIGMIYFKSEESIEKAIEFVGEDRIKKYMFYVED